MYSILADTRELSERHCEDRVQDGSSARHCLISGESSSTAQTGGVWQKGDVQDGRWHDGGGFREPIYLTHCDQYSVKTLFK